MTQFFKNLQIGYRLYAGFGLILFLTVSLAILSWIETSKFSRNFDSFGVLANETLQVAELDHDMGQMLFAVDRYLRSKTGADLKHAVNADEKFRENIGLSQHGLRSASRVALLNDISAHSTAYHNGLLQIAELTQRQNYLTEQKINKLEAEIAETLTKFNANLTNLGLLPSAKSIGSIQVSLKIVQVTLAKFVESSDPAEIGRMRDAFMEAQAGFDQLDAGLGKEFDDFTLPLRIALPDYSEAIEDIFKVLNQIEVTRREVLDVNALAIGEKIRQAGTSAQDDERRLQSEMSKSVAQARTQNTVIAIVATIFGVMIAWFIGRGITRPVLTLTSTMGRLADRDWTTEVEGTERKDELGQMARAVSFFKENGMEHERNQAEAGQRAEEQRKATREKMIEEYILPFDKSVGAALNALAANSTQLQATARMITLKSEEGQSQATTVAAASEEASANVRTAASAGEELSSSINEIARQVSESARISNEASVHAQQTNEQIKGLAEAASRIGDVISLITDIASQTNLLALNATIEAARAGEAGKGFAVVASEVKNLANQTAKATDDIGAKIAEMQAATNLSVEAIQTITVTIGRISEINTAVASAVEEQGAATQEIAQNVQEAARGAQEVSASVQGITLAISDTSAAASQVASSANNLSSQGEILRAEVNIFLEKIRAA